MFKVGVIGCGYWGPNLIRNFTQISRSDVIRVADLNEDRLQHMKGLYPKIVTTTNYREIISDPDIDIVAVATPVHTHHKFAREAISAKKHVFVEKPIASSSEEAEDLIFLSKKNDVKLMVGHTFLFTAAVRKMKDIIKAKVTDHIIEQLENDIFWDIHNSVWGFFKFNETNINITKENIEKKNIGSIRVEGKTDKCNYYNMKILRYRGIKNRNHCLQNTS